VSHTGIASPSRRIAAETTKASAPALNTANVRPIVIGLMLAMFLVALDGTIVSTAMPRIAGELGGFSLYAWVPSIYLLTTAVTTPIYGKLSDLFGRKRILFVGIGLFLLGSVLSGAASSMFLLIVFRAVQGVGAGAVLPVTNTIIGDIFSLEQRARIQGIFGSVWGASAVIGPLLGGFLVDSVGWRWIFYLNLPVGALATFMIGRFFHERATPKRHRLDLAGAGLLSCALSAILLLLIEGGQAWSWLSIQTVLLAVATLIGLVLFVGVERRAAEPVFPLDLFRSRIIVVSSVGMCFAGALMVAVTFEVPLFVQGVLGQDALHGGLALAPMTLGWPLAGAFSGRLALRFGYRVTAVTGLLCDVIGVGLLLTLTTDSSFATASAYSFLVGVGLGLSSTPLLIAVQSAVTWTRRGVATATNMFVRSFGSVVGLAVMGALVNNATQGSASATNQALQSTKGVPSALLRHIQTSLLNGIHAAFAAALVAAVLGLIVVLFLPGGSARDHAVRESAPT
jgi:EmrB/QacA subfamily drug resistance transporter